MKGNLKISKDKMEKQKDIAKSLISGIGKLGQQTF
jgi:hypothetical protein